MRLVNLIPVALLTAFTVVAIPAEPEAFTPYRRDELESKIFRRCYTEDCTAAGLKCACCNCTNCGTGGTYSGCKCVTCYKPRSVLEETADVVERDALEPALCVDGCYVGNKYYCDCPDGSKKERREAHEPDACVNGCTLNGKYYCQCPSVKLTREAHEPNACVNGCTINDKYYCQCPDPKLARDALEPNLCTHGCYDAQGKYHCDGNCGS